MNLKEKACAALDQQNTDRELERLRALNAQKDDLTKAAVICARQVLKEHITQHDVDWLERQSYEANGFGAEFKIDGVEFRVTRFIEQWNRPRRSYPGAPILRDWTLWVRLPKARKVHYRELRRKIEWEPVTSLPQLARKLGCP